LPLLCFALALFLLLLRLRRRPVAFFALNLALPTPPPPPARPPFRSCDDGEFVLDSAEVAEEAAVERKEVRRVKPLLSELQVPEWQELAKDGGSGEIC
jgi:hypothetical protein